MLPGRKLVCLFAGRIGKDIADDVTLSNDEDGVADWIEKNILKAM